MSEDEKITTVWEGEEIKKVKQRGAQRLLEPIGDKERLGAVKNMRTH